MNLRDKAINSAKEFFDSNPKFRIRDMTLADLDELVNLDGLVFGSQNWDKEIFASQISLSNGYYILAEELVDKKANGKIIAFGGGRREKEDDTLALVTLGTHPDYRGQKIGKAMFTALVLHAIVSDLKTITLEVRVSNTKAHKLYEKFNFHNRGELKDFYEDNGESAYFFCTKSTREDEFLNNFIDRVNDLRSS